MRSYIFVLLIVFIATSCDKTADISEDLIGEWVYERELFIKDVSNIIEDESGIIHFNEDNTGSWTPSDDIFSSINFDLDWEVIQNGERITVTKTLKTIFTTSIPATKIYELNRTDENNFTLTYQLEGLDEMTNTTEVVQFENIILTRKQ